MAKRQTRRSISVSRSTYERLRAYCETNGISMSQFVEHRVGDFLGRSIRRPAGQGAPMAIIDGMGERREGVMAVPSAPVTDTASDRVSEPVAERVPPARPVAPQPAPAVLTPPAPPPQTRTTIVPRPAQPAPPPAKLKPDQIFTF